MLDTQGDVFHPEVDPARTRMSSTPSVDSSAPRDAIADLRECERSRGAQTPDGRVDGIDATARRV